MKSCRAGLFGERCVFESFLFLIHGNIGFYGGMLHVRLLRRIRNDKRAFRTALDDGREILYTVHEIGPCGPSWSANMAGKLFQDDYDYGAVVREYYIDQMGQPYVRESSYEMMFHGPGDHIGTPGPLTGTREYNISFSQLRAAARTAGQRAYMEISETNWEAAVKNVSPGKKRKRMRGLKYSGE